MAAGTQVDFSPLLAGLECTERSLTLISCLIYPKTKPEPGGSAGPSRAGPSRAGSTATSPQEFKTHAATADRTTAQVG